MQHRSRHLLQLVCLYLWQGIGKPHQSYVLEHSILGAQTLIVHQSACSFLGCHGWHHAWAERRKEAAMSSPSCDAVPFRGSACRLETGSDYFTSAVPCRMQHGDIPAGVLGRPSDGTVDLFLEVSYIRS